MPSLVALLLFLFGLAALPRALRARALPPKTCSNTRSGRHYLADSDGFLCARSSMDYSTGCCTPGQKYSCETCQLGDKCCSSYEHCVSCCLKPGHNADTLWQEQYRIHKFPSTGKWPNAFQYCAGKCRTHKRSTEHENAYIGSRHFCFSDAARPKTAPPAALPDHIKPVVSKKGDDCHRACNQARMACREDAFPAISQCDIMRDYFECEAGCRVMGGKQESPAYVPYGMPKPVFPTLCYLPEDGEQKSCGALAAHAKRLCPCVERIQSSQISEAADSQDEGSQD